MVSILPALKPNLLTTISMTKNVTHEKMMPQSTARNEVLVFILLLAKRFIKTIDVINTAIKRPGKALESSINSLNILFIINN